MANLEKILIVDDDKNLLSGIRRQLREHFEVTIAVGGAQALEALTEKGPFAVIVSDMRMPEMTGVELLGAFKERAPETVRMMLTGNADQNTAADAINSGSIFRFFYQAMRRGRSYRRHHRRHQTVSIADGGKGTS